MIRKFRELRIPTCMLVHGKQFSGGTKRTWIFTVSIICTMASLNSGTGLTSAVTTFLRDSCKASFLFITSGAPNSLGIRTPWFIQERWWTTAWNWSKLFTMKVSLLLVGPKLTTPALTLDSILLKPSTSLSETGFQSATLVDFVHASTIVWPSTWGWFTWISAWK